MQILMLTSLKNIICRMIQSEDVWYILFVLAEYSSDSLKSNIFTTMTDSMQYDIALTQKTRVFVDLMTIWEDMFSCVKFMSHSTSSKFSAIWTIFILVIVARTMNHTWFMLYIKHFPSVNVLLYMLVQSYLPIPSH
jgi:hypothetical protein